MRNRSGFLFALLVAGLLAGCSSRSPSVITPTLPSLVNRQPAIIFVHGFYGSALRKKNHGRRIFFTGWEALFGTGALSLFQKELGTPSGPELEVEGVLGRVPVVPGLYEIDVYSRFLQNLRASQREYQVLPLIYDWRGDLSEPVQQLASLVKLLKEKGVPRISIVAHSMGGTIATYYLGYGTQPPATAKLNWEGAKKINKVIFFGTPFEGSAVTFYSFQYGSGLAQSKRLLNADTMSSFPSMYQLLPSSIDLMNAKGSPSTYLLFDPSFWKKYALGLHRRERLPSGLQSAREAFTAEQLKKGRAWRERVMLGRSDAWPSPSHLKIMNVVGGSQSTLALGYFFPEKKELLFDPESIQAAGLKPEAVLRPGDGSVTLASATVPPALEAATKVIRTEYSHEHLFLDPKVEEEYNGFLATP